MIAAADAIAGWAMDHEIVWSTAERDVPLIRQALVQAIEKG